MLHASVLAVLVLPLFILNARWGVDGNGDSIAVAIPAWEVAGGGSLDLSHIDTIADEQEVLERWYPLTTDGRIVSNRAPGLISMAIPSYLLFGTESFSNGPATLMALLATTAALGIVWITLQRLVDLTFATSATVVLALGTTTWAVSSAELWPHGPGQLWAAIAVWAVSAQAYGRAGLAFGLSMTTRPLTGIFAAVTGVLEGARRRDWRPVLKIAVFSSIGFALVLIYNRWLFGSWSLRGGYSDSFTSGALDRFTIASYARNVWEMFLGPRNGVLVTTPIVGIAVYGAIRFRKAIAPWMQSLLGAAVAYLLIHAMLNRASGGATIFYRYPLEAIVLASPALVVGANRLWDSGRLGEMLVTITAIISIVLQFLNVFVFSCWITDPVVPACVLT